MPSPSTLALALAHTLTRTLTRTLTLTLTQNAIRAKYEEELHQAAIQFDVPALDPYGNAATSTTHDPESGDVPTVVLGDNFGPGAHFEPRREGASSSASGKMRRARSAPHLVEARISDITESTTEGPAATSAGGAMGGVERRGLDGVGGGMRRITSVGGLVQLDPAEVALESRTWISAHNGWSCRNVLNLWSEVTRLNLCT